MRRTVKRTVTIVTTTHYTICWDATPPPSEPAPEPTPLALPEPIPLTQDPPTKEFDQTIAENEPTPTSGRSISSFQSGEQP